MIPLSVLDLSVVTTGTKPAAALRNSIDLARHVDGLGYVRYWLAEHHNLASVASPAPDLMIGQIAAVTKNIRVGSGGVMLPNHAPLVIAERFKMLEALFPGRIDLGLGRAPGTDGATAYALRTRLDARQGDDFLERLHELTLWETRDFPANHPYNNVVAMPDDSPLPPILLLGSSDYSSELAAPGGVGFGFAHHFASYDAIEALIHYRRRFKPSGWRTTPHGILAVAAVAAETDAGAERPGAGVGFQPVGAGPRPASAAAQHRGGIGLSLHRCRARRDRAQPCAAVCRQPGDGDGEAAADDRGQPGQRTDDHHRR